MTHRYNEKRLIEALRTVLAQVITKRRQAAKLSFTL